MFQRSQINQIYAALKEVGDFQKRKHRTLSISDIEEKSLNQLVSSVDIESENQLVRTLSKITPSASFITEEDTVDQISSENRWIIDPLDGTTNYLFGHQQYSISIAYQKGEQTVFGCVYIPWEKELFMADESGAYLNDHEYKISGKTHLADSLLATGFPYHDFEEIDSYLAVLKDLMKQTKGLRRMGSAAIDLVYTSEYRFDAFFEMNLSPWDVAAGSYIVQQAGGTVCDFKGGDDFVFGNSILAGNKEIVPRLLDVIQSHIAL
ncbi:MAG: inositol monophosphatase [Bacteroidia bacterium]